MSEKEFTTIGKIKSYISSGHTPYKHDISQGDVKFITVECINDLSLDMDKSKRITEEQFENEFEKNYAQKGSVLCTIKRRICKAFPFINEVNEPIAINQDVAIIIPDSSVNAAYLAVYLNCKVGQVLADKQKTGQMNPYISVSNLCDLPVHIPSNVFQLQIESVIKQAHQFQERSKALYQEAETLLLAELGIKDWEPTTETVEVKSFADSFGISERLDSEFYQPKFDELETKLRATTQNVTLGNVLTFCQRGTQPIYIEDNGTLVINSKHIRENKIEFADNRAASLEDTRSDLVIRKGDVLINGTGVGTIGRAAAYLLDTEALPDNHVTILRSKSLDPVFLALQLKRVLGN